MTQRTAIVLAGGVRPQDVFFAVAGTFAIGSDAIGAQFLGIALSAGQVTVFPGSSVQGRLLGQTGIAIQDSNIMARDDSCGAVTVTARESKIMPFAHDQLVRLHLPSPSRVPIPVGRWSPSPRSDQM